MARAARPWQALRGSPPIGEAPQSRLGSQRVPTDAGSARWKPGRPAEGARAAVRHLRCRRRRPDPLRALSCCRSLGLKRCEQAGRGPSCGGVPVIQEMLVTRLGAWMGSERGSAVNAASAGRETKCGTDGSRSSPIVQFWNSRHIEQHLQRLQAPLSGTSLPLQPLSTAMATCSPCALPGEVRANVPRSLPSRALQRVVVPAAAARAHRTARSVVAAAGGDKPSFGDELLDFMYAGKKLRKW